MGCHIVRAKTEEDLLAALQSEPYAIIQKTRYSYNAAVFSINPSTRRFTDLYPTVLHRGRIKPREAKYASFGVIKGDFCNICCNRLSCFALSNKSYNCTLVREKRTFSSVKATISPAKYHMNPREITSIKKLALALRLDQYTISWAYTSLLTPRTFEDITFKEYGEAGLSRAEPPEKTAVFTGDASGREHIFRLPRTKNLSIRKSEF